MIPALAFLLGVILVAIGVVIVEVYRTRRRLTLAKRMIDDLAPMMGFVLGVAQSPYTSADLRALARETIPLWLDALDRGQSTERTIH